MVPQGERRIVVIVPDHQLIKPHPHAQEGQKAEYRTHQGNAPVLSGAEPQAVIMLSLHFQHPIPISALQNGQQGNPSPPVCSL